jgi:acetyl esterase/lipase
MSTIKYSHIRGRQWLYRFGAYLILGSIPLLRKCLGEGEKQIRIPLGIQWERVNANGVASEWIVPSDAPLNTALLFLHGGGGVTGLYNSHRWMVGHIALACGIRALLPDYRLAPEHPFPSGLDDCVTAYRWLLSKGYQPERIVLAGDSLGGMLTISLLLALHQINQPLPKAAVCISPNTDPTCSGLTMRTNAWKDAILSPKYARTMMKLYVNGHDMHDPLLAPLQADLRGLPPILIQAGADEILLEDSVRFAECAKAAGTKVKLEVWPHMWHDWHMCVPSLPEANQAIDHIAKSVKSYNEF